MASEQHERVAEAAAIAITSPAAVLHLLREIEATPRLSSRATVLERWMVRAPETFRPLLFELWDPVPQSMQRVLLDAAFGAFGNQLPEMVSAARAGIAARLHLLMSEPDQIPAEELAVLLPSLRKLVAPAHIPRLLDQVARTGAPEAKSSVAYELLAHHRLHPLEPQELARIVEPLLSNSAARNVLLRWRDQLGLPAEVQHSLREAAFEDLALERIELSSVAWLAAEPERFWVALDQWPAPKPGVIRSAFSWERALPLETRLELVRAGLCLQMKPLAAHLFDRLVRSIPEGEVAHLGREMLDIDRVDLAADVLGARGQSEQLLPLVVEVLSRMEDPVLQRRWAHRAAQGIGRSLFGSARVSRGLTRTEAATMPATSPWGDRLRLEAQAQPLVAASLEAMAAVVDATRRAFIVEERDW
jgi:hypothetical protein